MGNRAVITTQEDLDNHGIGMYLHWNGGRDSVAPLLEYCRLRGFRGLPDTYGYARMAQIISNFMGGDGLSVGLGPVDTLDQNNYDNGVYIVNGWEIVGRLYAPEEEQNGYDRLDFLRALDQHQPEDQRIGPAMMDDLIRHGVTLGQATGGYYHYIMRDRKKDDVPAPRFEVGRTYLRYKFDTGDGFKVIGKDAHMVAATYGDKEKYCPLFHWLDGGESILFYDDNGSTRAVEPYQKP